MSCKKKTTILYLDNTFTFGGAINSLAHLLSAIDLEKYNPVVVSGQSADVMAEKFNQCKWYNVRIKVPWAHNKIYTKLCVLPFLQTSILRKILNRFRFIYWFVFITLPEALHYSWIGWRNDAKLVHLNVIFGCQLAGIIAAKILRVPCVAHLRMFEEVDRVTIFYAKFIDHHIAISSAIRDNLLELQIIDSDITVVHDAVDYDDFQEVIDLAYLEREFGECACNIGIFGRIVPWKGIREFTQAMQKVLVEYPGCKVFIVGDHSDGDHGYLDDISKIIQQAGLRDKMILTGYRSDVPALMQYMDIVVHASITPEPFGMVIIEAMAAGKPVVATAAGGPLDIVLHNQTGMLVEPGNVVEMAEQTGRLVNNYELRKQLGQAGQMRAREYFSSKRYAKAIESVYLQLIAS